MDALAQHTTVLLTEAIDALLTPADPTDHAAQDGLYVDATFGRGGHTRLLLTRLSPRGRVLAFDRDPQAVAEAASLSDARFSIRQQSFSHIAELQDASAAGILMDLGVSSPQIDTPARGFSFRFEGPLDMRMDTTCGQSVAQWLTDASVEKITEVIRDYGEERFAGPVSYTHLTLPTKRIV